MKNRFWISLFLYFFVLVIGLLIPASEGYNTIVWKLVIGQALALPVFLISLFTFKVINSKKSHKKD
ncbi:DUF4017 family protein [Bacillus thuringiensis]|uniref:DUF4017 family protein n=1 Tax=Bacillus thuringiensis TaxID=1428 RepID=UPI0021D6907D|nr:DUF4017 family protein [Bacillus thuringiensis]MCU7667706.1 DUF4017 family protein [Bacillus thuringiensis]